MTDLMQQPVSDLQLNQLKIEWVPRDSIHPNKYNPNKMTWHDRQLLLQSLLEDGWTQPVVTLLDCTIVDGEQRWTTSGIELKPAQIQEIIEKMEKRKADGFPESESILSRLYESKKRLEEAIENGLPSCLASVTGGLIPITRVDFGDDAHKMISTIRHNRARGSHQIDSMASITQDLVQLGLDFDDLERRLGMDDEEIKRFIQVAEGQMAQIAQELADSEFSPEVKIVHAAELMKDENTARELERSAKANEEAKKYQMQLAAREQEIRVQKQAQIAQIEKDKGASLTQMEKDKLESAIASSIPVPPKPAPPKLEKFVFMVTPAEAAIIRQAVGDNLVGCVLTLCEMVNSDQNVKDEMLLRIEEKQKTA